MSLLTQIKDIIVALLSNLGLPAAATNLMAEVSLFAIGIGIVIASPVVGIIVLVLIILVSLR